MACSLGLEHRLPAQRPPRAADTVRVTLGELEARLLQRNLDLIAARLGVGAARAAVEQARLRPNPTLSIEQNAFNRATGALFDYTKTGNTEISLQQLVPLAGKRQQQIALATVAGDVAEFQYADTLRQLRYALRIGFFDLYFLRRAIATDDRLIGVVEEAVRSAERMYTSRAILLSEVVRLRALLLSVQTERVGYLGELADLQGSLRSLLRDSVPGLPEYVPVLDSQRLDSLRVDTVSLAAALALAATSRADLRLSDAAMRSETANLSLQRALRVPDVVIGARYARAGSYIPNYFALTFGVDLPLFNRNQGSVHASEYTLSANERRVRAARQRVAQEVTTAYQKAIDIDAAYRGTDLRFVSEFDRLLAGITADYERRNVGIIAFTDFVDAYRQAMQQLTQMQETRVNAVEALNRAVGAPVVQP